MFMVEKPAKTLQVLMMSLLVKNIYLIRKILYYKGFLKCAPFEKSVISSLSAGRILMKTFIYMVRHGESPKTEGDERTRGLTEKGRSDAHIITELLKDERIDAFISSPYRRAMLTIEELAQSLNKKIIVFEDLRELVFLGNDQIMADNELYPLVKKMFSEPDFSLPGGESIRICQNRAVRTLQKILAQYRGQKVVIGTHGAVMTLMMGYFDNQYDLEFLLTTSKPDIYKMEFQDEVLVETKRLWRGANAERL